MYIKWGGGEGMVGRDFQRLLPDYDSWTIYKMSWQCMLCQKQTAAAVRTEVQADKARGLALSPAAPFQLYHNNQHNLMIPKCNFPLLYHQFYSGCILRVQKPGCRWAVEREDSGKGYCSWDWNRLRLHKGHIVLRRHVTLQRPWGLHNGPLHQCSVPTVRCSDSLPKICLK